MVKYKFILPLMLCLFLSDSLSACEFHSFISGTNPLYTRNVFGFRYKMRNVLFHHDEAMEALGADPHHGGLLSYGDCWGRFYLTKKTVALINLPLFFNNNGGNSLGDPSLLIQQQLLSTSRDSSFSLRWFAGGGVKFPLSQPATGQTENTFITGTGSWDLLFNSSVMATFKKIGFTIDAGYKIAGANKNHFKYGNVASGTLNLFYSIKIKKVKLLPSLIAFAEAANSSQDKGCNVDDSAYKNAYGGMGVDVFYKNLSLNISGMHSAWSTEAGLQEWRFQAGLTYLFGK